MRHACLTAKKLTFLPAGVKRSRYDIGRCLGGGTGSATGGRGGGGGKGDVDSAAAAAGHSSRSGHSLLGRVQVRAPTHQGYGLSVSLSGPHKPGIRTFSFLCPGPHQPGIPTCNRLTKRRESVRWGFSWLGWWSAYVLLERVCGRDGEGRGVGRETVPEGNVWGEGRAGERGRVGA